MHSEAVLFRKIFDQEKINKSFYQQRSSEAFPAIQSQHAGTKNTVIHLLKQNDNFITIIPTVRW